MALKTGIVGMPNVGKARIDMLQHARLAHVSTGLRVVVWNNDLPKPAHATCR